MRSTVTTSLPQQTWVLVGLLVISSLVSISHERTSDYRFALLGLVVALAAAAALLWGRTPGRVFVRVLVSVALVVCVAGILARLGVLSLPRVALFQPDLSNSSARVVERDVINLASCIWGTLAGGLTLWLLRVFARSSWPADLAAGRTRPGPGSALAGVFVLTGLSGALLGFNAPAAYHRVEVLDSPPSAPPSAEPGPSASPLPQVAVADAFTLAQAALGDSPEDRKLSALRKRLDDVASAARLAPLRYEGLRDTDGDAQDDDGRFALLSPDGSLACISALHSPRISIVSGPCPA